MIQVVRIILGFVIWSGFFLLIYAAQATGCAIGTDPARLRLVLMALFAVAIVAAIPPLRLAMRDRGPLGRSAWLASIAALASTILVFSGVIWMGPC